MSDATEIIQPILFVIRLFLWISAVIVMGLTAWAVTHVKGYRTIYTLVIAVLATAFYIPSFFTACMRRNRGYMLPLDIVFYALWLAAFIFVAQTDSALNDDGCHLFAWNITSSCARRNSIEAFTFLAFFWTLCGLCLETANLYLYGRSSMASPPANHPKKQTAVRDGPVSNSGGTNAETNGGAHPSATNGEHNVV